MDITPYATVVFNIIFASMLTNLLFLINVIRDHATPEERSRAFYPTHHALVGLTVLAVTGYVGWVVLTV